MIRFILILLSFSTLANDPDPRSRHKIPIPECSEVSTPKAPFFVSDTFDQGHLEYENLRDLGDPLNANRYLPRGSIVYTPPQFADRLGDAVRLPVRILSVMGDELEETADRSNRSQVNRIFRRLGNKTKAREGDVGYLDARSMKRAGEYTFYLSKDAPVYNSPQGNPLNGKKIRTKMNEDGEYVAKRCCFDFPLRDDPICFQFHLYDILNTNNEVIETAALKGLGCGFFGDLQSVPNPLDNSISNVYEMLNNQVHEDLEEMDIGDLELLSLPTTYKGRSQKTPMIKFPINLETNFAPFNMRKYKPTRSLDDSFVDPMAGCALLRVAQKWEQLCNEPGCEIQFGNLYHHDDWRPHTSHDSGYCFDIRLFRKNDDNNAGLDFDDPREGGNRYSRQRTQSFMELLMRAGASDMLLGDRTVIDNLNTSATRQRVHPTADRNYWTDRTYGRHAPAHDRGEVHDDHIHACFNPQNSRVEEACGGSLLQSERVPATERTAPRVNQR